MKFAHTVKQKTKIAALLFGVMACTILIRFLEDKSIKSMNNAFISLYNDRLIPATDLFYLAENLYAKRYILEAFIEHQPKKESEHELLQRLVKHDANINSLLQKYEKTFLTQQEKTYLAELKAKLKENKTIEDRIIAAETTQANGATKSLFETTGLDSFNSINSKLAELTQLQTKVGEELMKDSKYLVSGSKLYSGIQFALAIVIGILIVSIIFASNVVKTTNQKFNLN
ncbi:MCP four helix bundle domain-containing protein [Pedobacter sp. Hv1]|uniref:MCP four helix bundle domain-containing protein n=1 Tax=Pedobacter sp. Hv1 TaxID=1740090 RepID=UPI0006D8B0DD|nr:MCP four helix bundle domain-containing protein [Pedobacter sp. Hv1]KQC01719.1 hypothetical protein AQF98_04925 [Pedobacter sp. Hv1]